MNSFIYELLHFETLKHNLMKPLSFVFGLLFLNSLNAQTLRPDSSFAEVGRIITTNEVELVGIYDVEIAADGSAYLIGTGERFTDDSFGYIPSSR